MAQSCVLLFFLRECPSWYFPKTLGPYHVSEILALITKRPYTSKSYKLFLRTSYERTVAITLWPNHSSSFFGTEHQAYCYTAGYVKYSSTSYVSFGHKILLARISCSRIYLIEYHALPPQWQCGGRTYWNVTQRSRSCQSTFRITNPASTDLPSTETDDRRLQIPT